MNLLLMALASLLVSGSWSSKKVEIEIYPVKLASSSDAESFDFGNQRLRPLKEKPAFTLKNVNEVQNSDGETRYVLGESNERLLAKASKKLRGQKVAFVQSGQVVALT